jgi:hypothetical protein
MVQVIKSQIITERVQTVQGEITVNLNLTITLNQDGSLSIGATPHSPIALKKIDPVESTQFIIPDFDSPTELLSNFGEDVGG